MTKEMGKQEAYLLFLATELLLLETDALVGEILRKDSGRIPGVANILGEFGSTVSLVENVFGKRLEVLKMSPVQSFLIRSEYLKTDGYDPQ
jgi:hypothetical protein